MNRCPSLDLPVAAVLGFAVASSTNQTEGRGVAVSTGDCVNSGTIQITSPRERSLVGGSSTLALHRLHFMAAASQDSSIDTADDTYRAVDTDDDSHASIASDVVGPLEPLLSTVPPLGVSSPPSSSHRARNALGSHRASVGDVCLPDPDLQPSVPLLGRAIPSNSLLHGGVMPAQSVPSVASSALADGIIRRCHTVEEADSLSVCSRQLLPTITRDRTEDDDDDDLVPVRIDMEGDCDPTSRLIEAIENLRDSIHDNTVVQSRNKNPRSRRSTVGQMSHNQSYKYDERLKVRNEKVMVELRVVFLKVGEIDTLKEFYHADCFVQAKWREPKLDSMSIEELKTIDLDRYWSPLLFIDNILSETKDATWLVAQGNDKGEVHIMERRRVKGVFLETLELNDFPLDVQDLTITITSERPDTEIDLVPDETEMSGINIQTFVDQQEWHLHEHIDVTKRVITQEFSSSMKSHPCMSVTCRAARRPGYFYWNVFLIMFFITSLSFATFAVPPDKPENRLQLSFTLFLTSVAFKFVINQSLPRISYLTYMFMISGLSFATFAVGVDKPEYRLRLSFTLVLTSVTFKYVITQSLPKISYLTYMDKYVLMSLAILCIVSIWHAIVTLIPCDLSTVKLPPSSATDNSRLGPNPLTPVQSQVLRTNLTRSEAYLLSSSSSVLSSNNDSSKVPPKATSKPPTHGQVPCQSHKAKKKIERDVFVSFSFLYILAHFIFILWLYFDASKRRREMRKRDKEYKLRFSSYRCSHSCSTEDENRVEEWLEKKKEWQQKQKSKDQSNSRRQSGLLVHSV